MRRDRPRSKTTASSRSSTSRPAAPAASAPRTAPRWRSIHNLDDEALFGRLAIMTEGVERPVIGFYCKECAGAAISLSGLRHDAYPENVRLVELPCLGRVSALHIVEAARLGAAGVFLAGCAEGRCQYRRGDLSAADQVKLAGELLVEAGQSMPLGALAPVRRRPSHRGSPHPPLLRRRGRLRHRRRRPRPRRRLCSIVHGRRGKRGLSGR